MGRLNVRGSESHHCRFLFWPKYIEGQFKWLTFARLIKHWDSNPETGSSYLYKIEWKL